MGYSPLIFLKNKIFRDGLDGDHALRIRLKGRPVEKALVDAPGHVKAEKTGPAHFRVSEFIVIGKARDTLKMMFS